MFWLLLSFWSLKALDSLPLLLNKAAWCSSKIHFLCSTEKKRKKLKEVRNNMRVNDRMMTHKIINKNNFRWPVPLNTNRGKIRADLIRKKTDKNYIYVYKRQRYSLNNCYIPAKRWNVIFTELEFSRRCLLYIKCRKTVSPEEVYNGAQK